VEVGADMGSAKWLGSGSSGIGPKCNGGGWSKGEGGNGLCEEVVEGTGPKSEGVVLGEK
jgi:hypothetical protein